MSAFTPTAITNVFQSGSDFKAMDEKRTYTADPLDTWKDSKGLDLAIRKIRGKAGRLNRLLLMPVSTAHELRWQRIAAPITGQSAGLPDNGSPILDTGRSI
jgi:hypothetical protein